MGEPLNNYSALVEAIQIITGNPFQLSPKRITVSTVGTTGLHNLELFSKMNTCITIFFLHVDSSSHLSIA